MSLEASEKQVISKQRVTDHGEVFTNQREVKAMLDLVKQETERIESRFLEPACGTGNFLAEVLERKLQVVKMRYGKVQLEYERNAVLAISSIYGIDILEDNIQECRDRLFNIFNQKYTSANSLAFHSLLDFVTHHVAHGIGFAKK
jgi:SAM-dependent methyltransferase